MLANNIRDLEGDKENGRRTIAILIGKNRAIKLLATMFAFSYVWVIFLVLFIQAPIWLFITFLSIPKAIQAVKGFIGKAEPFEMMPAMAATAKHNTIYGLLMSVGMLISYFI